jgi:5'-3' exonuclease
VVAKFGVGPTSIPDYLSFVGDTADGYPGIPGWGEKAAALVFSHYPHLEQIPTSWREWNPLIRRAQRFSESLFSQWNNAVIFRMLATLRLDVPVFDSIEDHRWKGPRDDFKQYCDRLKTTALVATSISLPRPASFGRRRAT